MLVENFPCANFNACLAEFEGWDLGGGTAQGICSGPEVLTRPLLDPPLDPPGLAPGPAPGPTLGPTPGPPWTCPWTYTRTHPWTPLDPPLDCAHPRFSPLERQTCDQIGFRPRIAECLSQN